MNKHTAAIKLGAELFGKKKYEKAIPSLTLASEVEPFFAFMLGEVYHHLGKSINHGLAFDWYQKAALNGCVEGQTMMGMLHLAGEGVLQDLNKAREFLLKSALDGDVLAQAKLGQIYYEGIGVEPIPNEAFIWFEKAAQSGNPEAQSMVGSMLMHGNGVASNPEEAIGWLKKASEQHSACASNNLGVAYVLGRGVEKDEKTARCFFELSSSLGDEKAAYTIKELGKFGYAKVATDLHEMDLDFRSRY
ncbi:MAG: sel1 repeat family protein [Endozoicomonadaceae bacterium]|nr:sel1 repeat family protein [Endozoicomonadaceae bacterium]